mgnify:CR=1 FL=1
MTKDSNSIIKDITIREINRNMKQTIGSNNMGKTIINRNKLKSIENKHKSKKKINKIRINISNMEISIIIKIVIVRVRMSK